jgi:hypothetical protein
VNGDAGKMAGANLLRLIVVNMDSTTEAVNLRFTAPELLRIYTAHLEGDWDFYPDQWTEEQLLAAAHYGEVPRFGDDESPLPPLPRLAVAACVVSDCGRAAGLGDYFCRKHGGDAMACGVCGSVECPGHPA